MMFLKDGRTELYQWDTGREIALNGECSQFHFSNKVFGSTIDVDATFSDGISTAKIPDFLLQSILPLNVYAYVGTDTDGYTKISKQFNIIRRNKPADYVFTPTDQMTIEDIKTIAQSVRDDANAGKFDGFSPSARVEKTDSGVKITITDKDGTTTENVSEGVQGPEGPQGPQGDTGAKGDKGDKGETGTSGKSAYQIALDNGYTGTEQEWLASLKGTDGKNGTDGADGLNGADGVSPTVKTEPIENGHKVTITDKDGAKAFEVLNGKDGQGSSTQSDWNVNDSNSPAFVKNRPFYDKVVLEKVYEKKSTVFAYQSDLRMYLANVDLLRPLKKGETLVFNWNGKIYISPVKELEEFPNALVAGNLSPLGLGENTGEPYLLKISADRNGAMIVNYEQTANVELEMSSQVPSTVKIPEKFLPQIPEDKLPLLSRTVYIDKPYTEWTNEEENTCMSLLKQGITVFAKDEFGDAKNRLLYFNSTSYEKEICFVEDDAIVFREWFEGRWRKLVLLNYYLASTMQDVKYLQWNEKGDAINIGASGFLRSSTIESTKQFKITVDDTGTLRTEEIV